MLSKEELEKYKNYPEGSGGKMLYDKNTLTKSDFFAKYYSKIDLSDWNRWIVSNVNQAWSKSDRNEFIKRWGDRMKNFDFEKMENFYSDNPQLEFFDEDVKKFMAFMAGDGFFESNNIDFNEWIKSKFFINPIKNYESDVTIYEALNLKGGMNYIRKQLMNLHWWKQ